MKKQHKTALGISLSLLAAFVFWTTAVQYYDVQAIGPQNSSVGFATVNQYIHHMTGVNFTLYTITDWLGLVPIAVCLGFAILGLAQWIKRKSLFKVDYSLFILGGFYLITIAAYIFFEYTVINYRPVLINDYLEASYPSSTTLLVLCVMPTAMLQLAERTRHKVLRAGILLVIAAFIAYMVVGRFLSGVHWVSDIIGGILLSAGLVMLFYALSSLKS